MYFWNPSKEEIQQWVESKEKRENQNPQLSIEYWLQRYPFTNLHECFFTTFASELHEWLSRLTENNMFSRRLRPMD